MKNLSRLAYFLLAFSIGVSVTLPLPAVAQSHSTPRLQSKPRIYLMTALQTDDSDPVGLEQALSNVQKSVDTLVPFGDSLGPFVIAGSRWRAIRSDLLTSRAQIEEYRSRKPLVPFANLPVGVLVGSHTFWRNPLKEKDRMNLILRLQSSYITMDKASTDILGPNSKDPRKLELTKRLIESLTALRQLAALNEQQAQKSTQRGFVGQPEEAPGSWIVQAHQKLERLKPFFDVITIRGVRKADLAEALARPDTVAILWVGHSNSGTAMQVMSMDIITDAVGEDVSSLFANVHSNLRYLALLGCKAKPIFDKFRANGAYKHAQRLHIDASDQVQIMGNVPFIKTTMTSVSEAIQNLNKEFEGELITRSANPLRLEPNETSTRTREVFCPAEPRRGLKVYIERDPSEKPRAEGVDTLLNLNDMAVVFIPANSTQTQEVYLPVSEDTPLNKLSLVAYGNFAKAKTKGIAYPPIFKIRSADGKIDWSLRRQKANNQPLGATMNIYNPNGSFLGPLDVVPDGVCQ